MDHEYSLTGRLWVKDLEPVLKGERERKVCICGRTLVLKADGSVDEPTDGLFAVAVALEDRCYAAECSEDDVAKLCSELSKAYATRVHFTLRHEEYGVMNVFNGGSDYEVVSEDCFECEYDRSVLVRRGRIL